MGSYPSKSCGMKNRIFIGDCRVALKQIESESVDLVVTSPPYYMLRRYFPNQTTELGWEETPDLFVKNLCDIFDEVKRVLKKTGNCWVNMGVKFDDGHDLMVPEKFALEMKNRGWLKKRSIIWWKPNQLPASYKNDFTLDYEYFYRFVKTENFFFEQQFEPLKEISKKRAEYGWHGKKLLDGKSYDGISDTEKMGERYAPASGRNRRCVWSIPVKGLKEQHYACFPEKLIEPVILSSSPQDVCSKCGAPRVPDYEYEFKGATKQINKKRWGTGYDGMANEWEESAKRTLKGYKTCGCGADFVPSVVLDCFAGSGTTGLVARDLKRNYILMELQKDYLDIIKQRLRLNEQLPTGDEPEIIYV